MNDTVRYKNLFESYRWRLREIGAIESELNRIKNEINEGVASRSDIDPEWEQHMLAERDKIRSELRSVDNLIESIPNTVLLLPCKLYLRLHYVAGFSLTDTAIEMNVSPSTLRRIRRRCAVYFGCKDGDL